MPAGPAAEQAVYLDTFIKWITPFITFVFGFLVSRFTMSKKERKDYEAKLVETTNRLTGEQTHAFEAFSKAMFNYLNKKILPIWKISLKLLLRGKLTLITCPKFVMQYWLTT